MSEKNETADEKAPQTAPQPYRESEDHVPDPTSVNGTLETSDTGGGHHSSLRGVSRIFGSAEEFLARVESAAQDKVAELVADIKDMVHREETNGVQQTTEQDGLPAHEGTVVQGDATGHPAPNDGEGATVASESTPADQLQTGTADTSTEDAKTQSAPVASTNADQDASKTKAADNKAEQDAATGSKAPAKKTAAAKSTGSAKK